MDLAIHPALAITNRLLTELGDIGSLDSPTLPVAVLTQIVLTVAAFEAHHRGVRRPRPEDLVLFAQTDSETP